MAIHDINTIQINNVDRLKTLTNEYVLQSLSNLGQRLSTAPDGITADSFKLIDLFGNITDTSNYSITSISKSSTGEIQFNLYDNNFKCDKQKSITINHTSGIIYSPLITLDIPINNIIKYEGYIKADEDTIVTIFAGYDNENIIKEVVIDKFKKSTNELISGLRIIDGNEYYIYYNTDNTPNSKYKCNICSVKSCAEYWANLKNKIVGSTGIVDNVKLSRIYPETEHTATGNTIKIQYNTIDNIGFYAESDSDNIKTYINYFNYDVSVFIGYIKKYYTKIVYQEDNDQLKKQILVSLFKLITAEPTASDEIFIPLNYSFNFTCNSNDQWKIYGCETLIPVTYTLDDIDINYINNKVLSTILCKSYKATRISLYDFSVGYETTTNSDVIYGITVTKKYTMPYINSDNYWVINNEKTDIKADGENAGNPNIIIVYSSGATTEIMSSITSTNIDLQSQFVWEERTVKIEVPSKINFNANSKQERQVGISNDLFVKFNVPNIEIISLDDSKKDLFNLLKYSLIINISKASNCNNTTSDELIEPFGEDGCVTTIWHLDYNTTTNKYEYKCLLRPGSSEDDDSYAMDFNYLCDFNNLIKWQIENADYKTPDKYGHSWVVFNDANYELKNNENDEKEVVCPVIVNRKQTEYNDTTFNKFNLAIQYKTFSSNFADDVKDNFITELPGGSPTKFLSTAVSDGKVSNVINLYGDAATDYFPKSDNSIPLLDLGDILVKDNNVLNRVNVISLDAQGTPYYSYIGSQFMGDNPIKNELTIGTANTNINVSTQTMVNSIGETGIFTPVDKVNINFTYTYVSTYLTVGNDVNIIGSLATHQVWNTKIINNVTYYSTLYTPIGNTDSTPMIHSCSYNSTTPHIDNMSTNSNCTWALLLGNYDNKNTFICRCLNIKKMLSDLLFDDSVLGTAEFSSKNSVIFGVNRFWLKTSTLQQNSSGNVIGNPIEITYYKDSNSKYYFTFNEPSINNMVTTIYKFS